jgi:hypothetical protein
MEMRNSYCLLPNVYSTTSRFSRIGIAPAWFLDPPSVHLEMMLRLPADVFKRFLD